jgi:protein SCO1/2
VPVSEKNRKNVFLRLANPRVLGKFISVQLWKTLAAAGMISLAVSCKDSSQPAVVAASANQRTFQVRGVVRELKPDGKTVVIQHEAVTNYMPAMTMPFEVRDTNELRGLRPGDAIAFQMTVTDTDGWIHHLTRLNTVKASELPSRSTVFVSRDVDPLNIGDPLPDYHFTNEFGKAVSTGQFKGQPFVFTFFFTQCPYPLFCPLLSTHFEDAQKKLLALTNAPPKWHLLSISFDPEADTPEVLKTYAGRYQYNPEHWSFVTGDLIELTAIGDQVGEQFARNPGAGLSHNLRTVVVDAQGRIQKIYPNNDWTADELVAEILEGAAAKP